MASQRLFHLSERLRIAALIPILSVLATLIACDSVASPSSDVSELNAPSAFWDTLRVHGDEVEYFPTLARMAESADIVVTGSFGAFKRTRVIQGDAEEDVVVYAATTLDVQKVIRGGGPTDISLEFLLPIDISEVEETLKVLNTSLPVGPLLLFLRNKGGEEAAFYRVVNSYGVWAESPDGGVVAPLSAAPSDGPQLYLTETAAVATLEELAQSLGS